MVDFRVSIVLPAAGSGSRMCLDIPKQFVKICDRPLISYTIRAFESIPWVENIVVVTSLDEYKALESIILEFNHKKVFTTTGSSARHRSICNGIQFLNTSERKPDVVVIHDAVRPFIKEELLKDIVDAAWKHGACGVVRPLVSTVIARNEDGCLDQSLDRSKYLGSEMPQAFQYDVILNAYQKCTENEFDHGTECLQLALKYSQTRAFLLDGPDYLWKVTHKKDLYAVEGIIKRHLRQLVQLNGKNILPDLEMCIGKKFKAKGVKVIDVDVKDGSKPNILVNFDLLNQDGLKCSLDKLSGEVSSELQCIEPNGIFILVHGGAAQELTELQVTTQRISTMCKQAGITCCGVWCKHFLTFLENSNNNAVNYIAEMIVNVSLELPSCFSGQVFTVVDAT